MKPITLLLLALLFCGNLKAQSKVTESKDFNDLITSLQNEDWQNANRLSLICLKKTPQNEPDNNDAAMLRYMYIYSESGLMNLRKISKDNALKAIIALKGKTIILPGHPVSLKDSFNSIEMVNDKTDTLFIAASNSVATDIFSFEYVVLKEK